MKIEIAGVDALPHVAQELLDTYPQERFFAFFGKMGVGKTTLIKELCAQLNVADIVSSPTFAIVNEYATDDNKPVYHFDFYRLKSIAEAYDLGYEEYFYSGCYCFVEWTEKVEEILPDHYLRIEMAETEGLRTLTAEVITD